MFDGWYFELSIWLREKGHDNLAWRWVCIYCLAFPKIWGHQELVVEMLQAAQHLQTVEGIKTAWNNRFLTNLRKFIIKIKCILFHWNILIDIFYNSSVFLLSVTGQIASVSFEGNGASAGDTELYCKVSLHFNVNRIKSYT